MSHPDQHRVSIADAVVTGILSVIALLFGLSVVFMSSALVLHCTPRWDGTCGEELDLRAATGAFWGGTLASMTIPVIGLAVAIMRRRVLFVWPLMSIAGIVVSLVTGVLCSPELAPPGS